MKSTYDDFKKTLGEKLRDLRQKSGLSQEKLALIFGVSTRSIVRYEAGEEMPLFIFFKYWEYFKVPIQELWCVEENDSPDDISKLHNEIREEIDKLQMLCKKL